MDLFKFLTLIEGLSLFLFGMNVMGEALERRAGSGLRSLLGKMTTGKAAGLLTGLAVTAVIQSSSATTVMVVGFVNSSLMTLKQAINVIMGANIAIAAILSFMLANSLSKRIVEPLNQLNLDEPLGNEGYDELAPLLRRIHSQQQQLIAQAEQDEQRRREFTANVSHELKTPLQSISGYSELLKCGMAKPEDVQPFSTRIYSEAQRLIALVEDIINLSHLDAGTGYEWGDVNLYDAARKVIDSRKNLAAENGIQIALEGASTTMRGIPELVVDILCNLCDNAIKYNCLGGNVTVTVEKNNNAALLIVQDTGIGIPEEDLDRIFERFYRVDKSRSKEVGGTGLGLSIVKHAAQLMNAKINVDSKVGTGTAITITFPENTK